MERVTNIERLYLYFVTVTTASSKIGYLKLLRKKTWHDEEMLTLYYNEKLKELKNVRKYSLHRYNLAGHNRIM